MSIKQMLPPFLFLLVACGHHSGPDLADRKAPIVVAKPTRVLEPERISVSGTLMPQGSPSLVAFQVPGRALQVNLREGEPVKKGQVLAVLDAENLTHALEAARAQVAAAKAGADQAEQEYRRMKQLFDSKSLAPNDFAKFTASRDATRQQFEQAVAGEGVARKNLTEARLVAPINGYITKRMVEPGVTVGAGQPVFEIAQIDPIEVNVGVPETDIRLVQVGQAATISIPALPGKTYQGRVRVVDVSADPATRTYMTRILVPNRDHDLKLGMVAEVAITGSRMLDMLCLPLATIVRDPQGATLVYQYFPDQGRVYGKRVEVGAVWAARCRSVPAWRETRTSWCRASRPCATAWPRSPRVRGTDHDELHQSLPALPDPHRDPGPDGGPRGGAGRGRNAAHRGPHHHHPHRHRGGGLPRRYHRTGGEAGRQDPGGAHLQVPGGAQGEDLLHQPPGALHHQRGAGEESQESR